MAQPARSGSQMSSKQIAYAAIAGKALTFHFNDRSAQALRGYVIGMDDYHWLVAYIGPARGSQSDLAIDTSLVHKGSVARIDISRTATLDIENEAAAATLREMSTKFVQWCEKTYRGASVGANA